MVFGVGSGAAGVAPSRTTGLGVLFWAALARRLLGSSGPGFFSTSPHVRMVPRPRLRSWVCPDVGLLRGNCVQVYEGVSGGPGFCSMSPQVGSEPRPCTGPVTQHPPCQ